MDILFLLKLEQEQILQLAKTLKQELGEASSKFYLEGTYSELKKALLLYFSLDEEFLFQEIGELPNADKNIGFGISCHNNIKNIMNEIETCFSHSKNSHLPKLAEKLNELVLEHLEYQQRNIIPIMRENIPTQEREDLAKIFGEIKEESLLEKPRPEPHSGVVI